MKNAKRGSLALLIGASACAAACVAHAPWRLSTSAGDAAPIVTSVERLAEVRTRAEVAAHSVEVHPDFTLAVVEFDDQGRLWSREQVERLDGTLASEGRRTDSTGVVIVFFAHGWLHDARVCDPFVACFRAFLAEIAAETAAAARVAGAGFKPPRVVGVYAGWRGRSVKEPLAQLTFWSRKHAAERIGGGELVEVLTHLDQFVRRENAGGRFAALNVIGHSFGGTMVYTALANILKARLVEAVDRRGRVPADRNVVEGFGNLVVLVNPAFEASLYAPLQDLVEELGPSSRHQSPVLVVVSSETDGPNRLWFRLGRGINALFQRTGPRSARALLTTAVGDYEPFSTHRLEAVNASRASQRARTSACSCQLPVPGLSQDEAGKLAAFLTARRGGELTEGTGASQACAAGLTLGSARLVCRPGVDPSRPIWHVHAADEVVQGHSGFFTRPFLDFLRYMMIDALSKTGYGEPRTGTPG